MTFKRVAIFIITSIFLLIGSYFAIRFARGERFDAKTKTLQATGLLVANSVPDGASVFVDGKLKTATDDTINLTPGTYQVEIKKDGFYPWKKKLKIEKELVKKTDTYLFSTFPSLDSLTYTGASDPVISPDKQKVAFSVATDSASTGKRGLWVLDFSGHPLGFNKEPRQILASAIGGRDFSRANYRWSPDSKQLLVTLKNRPGQVRGKLIEENFIVDANKTNKVTELIDVTPNLETILGQWEKEEKIRLEEQVSKLPKELIKSIGKNIDQIKFSPDGKKILYTATASATIPDKIKPPLPASNNQPETRQIKPGGIYVYDFLEDKNFKINVQVKNNRKPDFQSGLGIRNLDSGFYICWFPTSQHLLLVQENKVTILEYDNTNWVDVYSGPFENGYAFPFSANDKILILTSLGENQPANLYSVSLR